MTRGPLSGLAAPAHWSWQDLWAVAPRVKEVGRPDLPALSVFLDAGVVPRSSREDNYNQLGEDLSRYLVVRPNDIVFNKLRTWQGGLGVSGHEGIVSPAYFVCRPKASAHPRFLHYLLRSGPYLAELTRISKWMPPSQFDTPWEQLRKLPLLLPPLDEQRRIADFLDAETARINQLLEARNKQVTMLAERDYALISEALVPGILTKKEGTGLFSWLPELPVDRPLVRLGYICRIQNGLTVDSKRDVAGDAVTRPYLRVANVQSGHLVLDSVTEITVPRTVAERTTLRVGDVLMTEGGDLDKLGRGTVWNGELPGCLHQNHVFALRPEKTVLDSHYLALMTQTVHARCYFESTGSKTTNLASTNSSKILGFPIPLPSLDVQHALVSQVHEELQATAKLRTLVNHQLALLAERRQALITAAVTGQFDVSTASGRNVTEGVEGAAV